MVLPRSQQLFSTPVVKGLIVVNRYRRKRPKVDASISDSAHSHTGPSDAAEKKKKILASTFEGFRLWTSFEYSPILVKSVKSRLWGGIFGSAFSLSYWIGYSVQKATFSEKQDYKLEMWMNFRYVFRYPNLRFSS